MVCGQEHESNETGSLVNVIAIPSISADARLATLLQALALRPPLKEAS